MKAALAQEVNACRDANGQLDLERVVEVARDPANPLHSRFEWDDSKCGIRFRIEQARQLVRELRIPVRIGAQVVHAPAYVPAVMTARPNVYERLDTIEPRSVKARQLMLDELTRVAGQLNRSRTIAAALDVEDELNLLLETVASVTETVKTKAGAE